MGRRSGYDRSGLPAGALGATKSDQTPTQQNHNLRATPATQGAPSSSSTVTQPPGITGSGSRSQGLTLTSEHAQSTSPASRARDLMSVQPHGFVPAHAPGPSIAASDFDSAREYGGIVSGRLQQQPRVPEGRSGLRNEVRRLDGPTDLPSVRAVPRHAVRTRVIAPSLMNPAAHTQQLARMVAPMPLSMSGAASDVTDQGLSRRMDTFIMAEYAHLNPQSPLPTSQKQLDDLARELEVERAAQATGVSAARGTGTYFPTVFDPIFCFDQTPLHQPVSLWIVVFLHPKFAELKRGYGPSPRRFPLIGPLQQTMSLPLFASPAELAQAFANFQRSWKTLRPLESPICAASLFFKYLPSFSYLVELFLFYFYVYIRGATC